MSGFWQMSRMMDRMMDEYIKEMARNENRQIAPYWRDADHSILQVANEAHEMVNDDKRFAVSIDVAQFKPEELKVNLDGRVLTVEGKQQHKDDHSFMSRYIGPSLAHGPCRKMQIQMLSEPSSTIRGNLLSRPQRWAQPVRGKVSRFIPHNVDKVEETDDCMI
ncbi:Hsp20/alpha crystallin family protein [Oesophagostomum dentatum]|uniref:Hsp20/alpha crystallin family protein n=1 Tax=Oesophagostomum dentatum TaxID=61180 RepID=A0A0B1SSE6_OESDE|nr:Hsp20/alpha crystallin family protein [Oesophagostomum dentatum]